MRIQIFAMLDDLLIIENACSLNGCRLEIGGVPESDAVLEDFQGVGGFWESVCYIECDHFYQSEKVLQEFNEVKHRLSAQGLRDALE